MSDKFDEIFSEKALWRRYLKKKLELKLPTILPQIFYKIIFSSKDVIKSIIDPDNNFLRLSQSRLMCTHGPTPMEIS